MNIDQRLEDLITAINENTAALRDVLASGTAPTNVVPIAAEKLAEKPAKPAKASKPTPATAPVAEVAPDEEEETPTPTPTPAAKATDTPHVPAPSAPGQPAAGEYVDVDEVISKIQATVKAKLMKGDTEQLKKDWETIRKSYGVDRITELRNDPAKLLDALKKAEAL